MVYVIAEIGINHNGSLDTAKSLIDVAVEAGADAVKFQKRTLEIVYTAKERAGERESPWGTTFEEQKRGLEFTESDYDEIDGYCRSAEIDWFASAWDIPSQEEMRKYNFPHNKIASAMLTHIPFLECVASEKRHTFISTGMATIDDIDTAVKTFQKADCPFTLLHCVSTYPCDDEDCNVKVIQTLKERYKTDVGYSGHERGLMPSILAVAEGASAVERHITLDRTMYGSDQAASLEPAGFKRLVRDIRKVSDTLGDGKKIFLDDEQPIAKKLRYFAQ